MLAAQGLTPTPQIAGRVDVGNGHLSGLVQNARERAFLDKPKIDVLGGGGEGGGKDPGVKATTAGNVILLKILAAIEKNDSKAPRGIAKIFP